jgi:hypothetical protein
MKKICRHKINNRSALPISVHISALAAMIALSGCANNAPANTALNTISDMVVGTLAGGQQRTPGRSPSAPNASTRYSPAQFKRFADTQLPGLLSNQPSPLNAREGFPKVALIPVYVPSIHNNSASSMTYGAQGGCWIFKAKIWTSAKKSEDVPEFSYCMPADIQTNSRLGILKVDLADVTTLKCIDSRMPASYMDSRKNGRGPNANYRIVPEDYLNKAMHVAGSEQLFFMLRDMGLSPKGGNQTPCRAWVTTNPWETKDF